MNRSTVQRTTERALRLGAGLVAFSVVSLAAGAGLPKLGDLAPITVLYGANPVSAFTPDGRAATIVMAHRENGNAHSYDLMLVTIDGSSSGAGRFRLPEVVDVERPDAGLSDVIRVEPFDGENEISAFRFARATVDGKPATLLLEAKRKTGQVSSLVDPTPVELTVWKLDGPSEEVGGPRYVFRLAGSTATTKTYCNATTALNKELGLPFPDGWDNEDTLDGCLPAAAQQRNDAASEMVRSLDITSFPNSIGPNRRDGARTFEQYGFHASGKYNDGWVYVDNDDHTWMFGILVMKDGATHKRLCVSDRAENGGTYHSVVAVDVDKGADGLWIAGRPSDPVPGCTE